MIYTGGCWLYGPADHGPVTEESSFTPIPEFAFMVEHRQRLLEDPHAAACIVHPAMVWHLWGGVLRHFADPAAAGGSPRVVGSTETRWPLVHRADLAELYALAIERGQRGADSHGVTVGRISAAIAEKYGAPDPIVQRVEEVVRERGGWANGLALDQ